MKSTSKIQKGRRFENYIAEQIEEMGLGKATREIGSGSGKRKGDIFSNLDFLLEAKNQKHLSWWASIDQSKKQAEQGNYARDKWALIIRDPRKGEFQDCYVVMDMWEWLSLLRKNKEPKIKQVDREMGWKIKKLIQSAKQVLKDLEK